jgi:hypothetical protein
MDMTSVLSSVVIGLAFLVIDKLLDRWLGRRAKAELMQGIGDVIDQKLRSVTEAVRRLAVTAWRDVALRSRIAAPGYRDVGVRLRLAAPGEMEPGPRPARRGARRRALRRDLIRLSRQLRRSVGWVR